MNFKSKWFQTCLSWFLRLRYINVLLEKRKLHYFLSTLKLFWAGMILSCNTYVKQRRAQNWFNCVWSILTLDPFWPWDIYNWHFDWVSMYFDNFIFECWALATTLMIPLPKTIFLSEIESSILFWDFVDSIPYYQDKSGIPISGVTWFDYLIW